MLLRLISLMDVVKVGNLLPDLEVLGVANGSFRRSVDLDVATCFDDP